MEDVFNALVESKAAKNEVNFLPSHAGEGTDNYRQTVLRIRQERFSEALNKFLQKYHISFIFYL